MTDDFVRYAKPLMADRPTSLGQRPPRSRAWRPTLPRKTAPTSPGLAVGPIRATGGGWLYNLPLLSLPAQRQRGHAAASLLAPTGGQARSFPPPHPVLHCVQFRERRRPWTGALGTCGRADPQRGAADPAMLHDILALARRQCRPHGGTAQQPREADIAPGSVGYAARLLGMLRVEDALPLLARYLREGNETIWRAWPRAGLSGPPAIEPARSLSRCRLPRRSARPHGARCVSPSIPILAVPFAPGVPPCRPSRGSPARVQAHHQRRTQFRVNPSRSRCSRRKRPSRGRSSTLPRCRSRWRMPRIGHGCPAAS